MGGPYGQDHVSLQGAPELRSRAVLPGLTRWNVSDRSCGSGSRTYHPLQPNRSINATESAPQAGPGRGWAR